MQVFVKRGWTEKKYRAYRCQACGKFWHNAELIGMYSIAMIEYAAFLYVRTMSLSNTVAIFQAWFNKNVLSKGILLDHIICLIDMLPGLGEVTNLFKPHRSGYYAWDGLWTKYRGADIVILICLDVKTLDILGYHPADDETYETWRALRDKIEQAESGILANAKGFFMDGELGLMKLFKEKHGNVPRQLCAFHKYSRIGQIIPFIRAKGIDKIIKSKVENVIFAPTKDAAQLALLDLKRYAQAHQENAKLRKVIGVLKRNFNLLLTHFDHPEMSPYNNVLEGFNHIVKRKLRLMKGFKKELNIDRWLKLILLDYRFHEIKSSSFKDRNGMSPLELAGVKLPKYFNWIKLVRKKIA